MYILYILGLAIALRVSGNEKLELYESCAATNADFLLLLFS